MPRPERFWVELTKRPIGLLGGSALTVAPAPAPVKPYSVTFSGSSPSSNLPKPASGLAFSGGGSLCQSGSS